MRISSDGPLTVRMGERLHLHDLPLIPLVTS
jgi:hypothetical protein